MVIKPQRSVTFYTKVLCREVLKPSQFAEENVGKEGALTESHTVAHLVANYRSEKLTINEFAIARNVIYSCSQRWSK